MLHKLVSCQYPDILILDTGQVHNKEVLGLPTPTGDIIHTQIKDIWGNQYFKFQSEEIYRNSTDGCVGECVCIFYETEITGQMIVISQCPSLISDLLRYWAVITAHSDSNKHGGSNKVETEAT